MLKDAEGLPFLKYLSSGVEMTKNTPKVRKIHLDTAELRTDGNSL